MAKEQKTALRVVQFAYLPEKLGSLAPPLADQSGAKVLVADSGSQDFHIACRIPLPPGKVSGVSP